MKQLINWISKATPYIVVIILFFILFCIFRCNNFSSTNSFVSLITLLVALIPFNYYYYSTASLEFKSFTKCNRRFDDLNELLNSIIKDTKDYELNTDKITELINSENIYKDSNKTINQIILDYLDLCAEEYYLYKYSGIISSKVWKHWLNGMLNYFKKDSIFYKVLENEIIKEDQFKDDSYYGFIKYLPQQIDYKNKN